jgi:hypothetical protein
MLELGGSRVGQLLSEEGEFFVSVEACEEGHFHLLAVGECSSWNNG